MILLASGLYAASIAGGVPGIRDDLFESEEELGAFHYDGSLTEREKEFYSAVTVSLITADPGDPVYIYFGHSALLIELPDSGSRMFDYGVFQFNDGFYINFALGRLYYMVIQSYAEPRMEEFIEEDRGITKTVLPLTDSQKKGVIEFLSYNTRRENSEYLYHYYNDNCATRLRDIYNWCTDDGFRVWAEAIDTGRTLRSYSTAYMHKSFPVAYALNYLQGPGIDRKISLYQACFLPDVLQRAIEEYAGIESEDIYTSRTREETPDSYSLIPGTLILSALLAALIALSASSRMGIRAVSGIALSLMYLLFAAASIVLIFMMLFTNHDVTYMNANAILLSPVLAAMAVMHILAIRNTERGKGIYTISRIMLAVTILMLIMKSLARNVFIQGNYPYYITALSIYAAELAAWGFRLSRSPDRRSERHRDAQGL